MFLLDELLHKRRTTFSYTIIVTNEISITVEQDGTLTCMNTENGRTIDFCSDIRTKTQHKQIKSVKLKEGRNPIQYIQEGFYPVPGQGVGISVNMRPKAGLY